MRTDRHDEANGRYSRRFESAFKIVKFCGECIALIKRHLDLSVPNSVCITIVTRHFIPSRHFHQLVILSF